MPESNITSVEPIPRTGVNSSTITNAGDLIRLTNDRVPLRFQNIPRVGFPWNVRNIYFPIGLEVVLVAAAAAIATLPFTAEILRNGIVVFSQSLTGSLRFSFTFGGIDDYRGYAYLLADLTNNPLLLRSGDELSVSIKAQNTHTVALQSTGFTFNGLWVGAGINQVMTTQNGALTYDQPQ